MRTLHGYIGVALILLSSGDLMAAEHHYTIEGRISDTSDNLLPNVRVALKRAGVLTHTDGNGQFSLSFSRDQPLTPDSKGVYEYVEMDKDGYQGRTVSLLDLAVFDAQGKTGSQARPSREKGKAEGHWRAELATPMTERLEPNPIGEDNVGFSTRMSMGYTLPHNTIKPKRPLYPLIGASEWDAYFKGIEARSKTGATERVSFHAYVPRKAGKLKAVFLISRHGIGSIDHPRLRAFADRHEIALVGILGDPLQRGFHPVSVIDEPLERLGRMVNHPELATVPVITFGHSNGTGFAGIIPSQRPERTIAWISYHSGASYHLQFPGVEKVPGLVMHGNIDQFAGNGQEQTVRNLRRDLNAAMALMMEGNVGHGPVDKDENATWDFIVEFCEAAMRIRLNDDGTVRPVAIERGWLGANYDRSTGGQQELAIAPYAEYKGDHAIANWLPDRTFAEIWQRYGKTDPRPARCHL